MAEPVEIQIKVDGRDAEAALRRLRGQLGGLDDGAKSAGASALGLGANLGGWVTVGKEAIAVVGDLVKGIKAFAAELDRQTAIINAFSGNLEEAQRRTSGLVSQLELMTASNRAAQTGLQLSSRDLANVAVAATQYSEATGDASMTTESLARAISSGSVRALRQVGIDLTGVTGQANKQRVALEQLEERYGNVTVSADNLGDYFQQLDVLSEDLKTSFFEGFGAATELNTAIEDLKTAIDPLLTSLGIDMPDAFELALRAGATFAAQIAHIVDGITALVRVVDELRSGNVGGALGQVGEAVEAFSQVSATGIVHDFAGRGGAGDRAVAARNARLAAGGGGDDEPPPGRGRRERAASGGSPEDIREFFAGLDERAQEEAAQRRIGRQEETEKYYERLLEYQEKLNASREEEAELIEDAQRRLEQRGAVERQILAEQNAMRQQMFDLAAQGAGVVAEAFNLAEGPKAAISAGLEVARAISDFASFNYVGGAGHLLSAAMFGVQAAKMGFASDSGAGVAGQAASARPAAATSGQATGGGATPSVVNLHINHPVSDWQLGRIQRRADRALERRMGGR